eukprot:8137555-Lingulodinium_polyedra.AAC.1
MPCRSIWSLAGALCSSSCRRQRGGIRARRVAEPGDGVPRPFDAAAPQKRWHNAGVRHRLPRVPPPCRQ